MKYESIIYQMTVEDHTFWVAESKVLKGCVGQGETSDEALKELEANEIEWIETAELVGIPVPEQTSHVSFQHNGKVALRLAPNIHAEAAANAAELDISLNQYLNNAIVEYNANIKNFLRKTIAETTSDTYENVINFPYHYSKPSRTVFDVPYEN